MTNKAYTGSRVMFSKYEIRSNRTHDPIIKYTIHVRQVNVYIHPLCRKYTQTFLIIYIYKENINKRRIIILFLHFSGSWLNNLYRAEHIGILYLEVARLIIYNWESITHTKCCYTLVIFLIFPKNAKMYFFRLQRLGLVQKIRKF